MLKRLLTLGITMALVLFHTTNALAVVNFDIMGKRIGTWSSERGTGITYSSNNSGFLYELYNDHYPFLSCTIKLGDRDTFYNVKIDGNVVESSTNSDGSRSISLESYLDGKIHTISVSYNSWFGFPFEECIGFISNAEEILSNEDKILYSICDKYFSHNGITICDTQESIAIVRGYLFGLEELNIPNSIWVDNKEYPVRYISEYLFDTEKYANHPTSIVLPQNIRSFHWSTFGSGIQHLTILSSADLHSLIPREITLHTFPKNIKAFYSDLDTSIKIEPLRDIEILDESATLDQISFRIKNDIGARIYQFPEEDKGTMTVSNGLYVDSKLDVGKENTRELSYEHPDYGRLDWTIRINAPSPLSSVECNTTQSTATFHVNTYQNDSRIGEPYILYNDKTFYCDNNGDITVSGLDSNTSDWQTIRVQFKENEYTSSCAYKTLPMNPDMIAEVGPTSISVTPTYDKIDGIIKSSSLTINGQEYAGKAQSISGLTPGSSVSVVYSLNNENVERVFQLPELVLNTLPARATSKDCAIICAETNMSEDEIGGGFEWRRYDAPDMVPSNSVACPVANGHMEGRLNGLSSGTYYKYRPFYEDASGQKAYGEWTAFGTADVDVYFVPTVYTYTACSVGSTSATLVGYALAGSEDVIEQGFEYWPEVTSRAATTEVKRVLATGQRMMATIDDLEPGMTYNVRAFATTKTETTYGELQQFETEAIDDPIEDSIEEVETVEPVGQFDIYTVTGVCVRRNATDFSGLRSGIYIANGRKIMVR